jgi:hypothetical protein
MVSFTPWLFNPGERAPGAHWIGGWVGLRAGLDDLEKRKFLNLLGTYSNSDPSVVQLIASRYTDYAIPAPEIRTYRTNCAYAVLFDNLKS